MILPSDTGDVKASGALDKVKAYLEKHCQSNLFIELCIEIRTSAIYCKYTASRHHFILNSVASIGLLGGGPKLEHKTTFRAVEVESFNVLLRVLQCHSF